MQLEPVGIFRCPEKYPYDAARQGAVAAENTGYVELHSGRNFEQAVQDLDGFSHIWLIYQFHENENWKPMVTPPRFNRKVGVFACRAPYRPNPIGMSCVQLLSVKGRRIEVAGHDLLNGTPILDIKPYLPYADSFPDATCGWLEDIGEPIWEVRFSDTAQAQADWLKTQGVDCLEAFLVQQLTHQPFNQRKKRLRSLPDNQWEIAYRTWRVRFSADAAQSILTMEALYSGYSREELASVDDPYADKAVHRQFMEQFEHEA